MQIAPLPEADATDKTAQTYGRVRELLGTEQLPECFLLFGSVPSFLQDFYMNFKKFVWTAGQLDEATKATIALAVSSAQRCPSLVTMFEERCESLGISAEQRAEIVAVASTCLMYNVFFKFRDLSGSELFGGMPVGLRAHTFSNTSLDAKTVELINIAISDINGCKPCTTGHVDEARRQGVKDEALLETIQCAATIVSGAAFLNAAAT